MDQEVKRVYLNLLKHQYYVKAVDNYEIMTRNEYQASITNVVTIWFNAHWICLPIKLSVTKILWERSFE